MAPCMRSTLFWKIHWACAGGRTESLVPTHRTLSVAAQNVAYVPQIRTREAFYKSVQPVILSKTLAEMGGEQYQVVDMGKHKLHSQMYFYVAPPNRADIESVFVDRFVLVREAQ